MGLTKRQEEMIAEIIVEHSKAAAESQRERHVILEGIDDEPIVITEAPQRLEPGFKAVIQDLVETFLATNVVYEGHEFDGGAAKRRAASYLKRLVENDLMEVRQMLRDGDFTDEG